MTPPDESNAPDPVTVESTEPDLRATLERARMGLKNAAELAKERGFPEWADTLGGHMLAADVALSCECGGTGELPSGWPCICSIAEDQCGVRVERVVPSRDFQVEFAEARSMIRRVVEDWPYQPPEVIYPEQQAFAAWLRDNPFDMVAGLAALSAQAEEADRDC